MSQNQTDDNDKYPEEFKYVYRVNHGVMSIDPNKDPTYDTKKHGVRPQLTQLCREIKHIATLAKIRGKEDLREVFKRDIEEERKLLNMIEKDFMLTQP